MYIFFSVMMIVVAFTVFQLLRVRTCVRERQRDRGVCSFGSLPPVRGKSMLHCRY